MKSQKSVSDMERENPQSAVPVQPDFKIIVSPALAVRGRPADPRELRRLLEERLSRAG